MAGEGQPPIVHALAHAMNAALGNAGRTVIYTDPVEIAAGRSAAVDPRSRRGDGAGQVERC